MACFHWLYLCTCLVSWDGRVKVAGKWCDLSERGLVIGGSVVGGLRCGDFYGWWSFSSASKILFGDMDCSSFRWLFLENSA